MVDRVETYEKPARPDRPTGPGVDSDHRYVQVNSAGDYHRLTTQKGYEDAPKPAGVHFSSPMTGGEVRTVRIHKDKLAERQQEKMARSVGRMRRMGMGGGRRSGNETLVAVQQSIELPAAAMKERRE